MPRIEFNRYLELDKWIHYMRAKNKEYVAYITANDELILIPTTSTAPIICGYCANIEQETALKLVHKHYLKFFKIERFEWKSETMVKKE